MTTPTANDPDQLPANNRLALRRVARACRKASLATLMADGSGAPYASLVTVALDHDLAPVLLLSGLSDHTRNLRADARVSLLFDGTDGHPNPQTGPRVTIAGTAAPTADEALKRRFLARHPGAAMYAGFGDFGFWRIAPARAHFVGGFGRAVWFEAPFGLEPGAVAALRAAEPEMLAHMNDHHADAVDRVARAALGEAGGGWRMVAVDCDGCDLARADRVERVAFPTPLDSPMALKAAVAAMTKEGNP
ncbi:MAG: DUF2470 domain-containing protein [Pseudomonadota bacterium]